MNLKQQLVVKTPTDEFEIWSKKQYDEYIAGCVEYGVGSAYRIVTHFNEDENLLKDSPYQAGSAGVWVKASERVPDNYRSVHVRYTKEGKPRRWTIRYNGSAGQWINHGNDEIEEVAPDLEWLDESAASPAGDGWVSEKPDLQRECLFNTASWFKDHWEYGLWEIKKIDGGDGWYYGLCNNEGEEWGPIEDLKADKYLILPSPPNKSV